MLLDWNYRWRLYTAGLRAWPSIIIPGAQKGGTTFLASLLYQHPQVAQPSTKELHFFTTARSVEDEKHRYLMEMPPRWSGKRGIDASPDYMIFEQAAQRLAAAAPQARWLVVLRHPVDRLLSHFDHNRRMGREFFDLPTALEAEPWRASGLSLDLATSHRDYLKAYSHYSYLRKGDYAEQLLWIYAAVPQEQVMVIISEELFAKPQKVYDGVLKHLGLRPHRLTDTEAKNTGTRPDIPGELYARLVEHYAPKVAELEELLGRSTGWRDFS